MIRTLVCCAATLLLVGTLYAEDKEKAAAPEKKPEAKADAATQATPEKKPESAVPEHARRRGARPQADGQRGRVTKASIENGILKLSVEGKEHEFAVTDNTRAMIRTADKDGKQVVVGVQMMNGDPRQRVRRPDGQKRTRPRTKP